MTLRATLSLLVAVLLATPLAAGSPVYIEQIETLPQMMGQGGGTKKQLIWVDGGNYRIEEADAGRYTILSEAEKAAFIVDENGKTVTKVPIEQLSAMAAAGMQMLEAMGGGGESSATAEKTSWWSIWREQPTTRKR